MSRFTADWLALREPADLAARDPVLARRFAEALKRPKTPLVSSLPRQRESREAPGSAALDARFRGHDERRREPAQLIDLGAGTGANARALAPVIGGAQDWVLVEADPALIAAQDAAFAGWDGKTWRRSSLALDLAGPWAALDAFEFDGATCAALLDLASLAWLERLADWLAARRLPFLAALSVNGGRDWLPAAPEDGAIAAAFGRDQRRDKGLGPALGGAAAATLAGLLRDRGFAVTLAASDWRIGPGALLAALVRGEAEAAGHELAAAWREHRLGEAAGGTLGLTVGHDDLLAIPPEICDNPGSGRGSG